MSICGESSEQSLRYVRSVETGKRSVLVALFAIHIYMADRGLFRSQPALSIRLFASG